MMDQALLLYGVLLVPQGTLFSMLHTYTTHPLGLAFALPHPGQ